MSLLGALAQARSNWRSPGWWRHTAAPGARAAVRSASHPLVRAVHGPDGSGCDVLAEDWDTLVVLDGCRYDAFARHNPIPGALSPRTSRGSATAEFLAANFGDGPLYDTVYVTAHPYVSLLLETPLHAMVEVWRTGWAPTLRTVPPERVTRAAERAAATYPDKRLIVHYLQPHYPFVGERGRREIDGQAGVEWTRRQALAEPPRRDHDYTVWEQLERGRVSVETAWDAYCENLQLALPHVEALVASLSGRTVVTSDHGNCFGERAWPVPVRLFGHPVGVHVAPLVEVPWLVIESGERRAIVAEPPESSPATADRDRAVGRLRQLGYAE